MLLSFRPWTCFRSYIKCCDGAVCCKRSKRKRDSGSFLSIHHCLMQRVHSNLLVSWMKEVKCSYKTELITNAALRNGLRHFRCCKICVALIHSRAKKRVFSWIPLEIVLIMTRYLRDTRNQSDWDAKAIKWEPVLRSIWLRHRCWHGSISRRNRLLKHLTHVEANASMIFDTFRSVSNVSITYILCELGDVSIVVRSKTKKKLLRCAFFFFFFVMHIYKVLWVNHGEGNSINSVHVHPTEQRQVFLLFFL